MNPTPPDKQPPSLQQRPPLPEENTGGVSFIKEKTAETNPEPKLETKQVQKELEQSGITTTVDQNLASSLKKKTKSILRPLRTYKDDVAAILKRTKGSKVSIQAAEQERERKRLEEMKRRTEAEASARETEQKLKTQEETLRAQEKAQEAELKKKRAELAQKAEEEELKRQQAETQKLHDAHETLEEEQRRRAREQAQREKQQVQEHAVRQQELIAQQKIKEEQERIRNEQQQLQQAREARRQEATQQPPTQKEEGPHTNRLLVFGISMFLFLLGGGVLYGAYLWFFVETTNQSPQLAFDTLILAEEQREVDVTGLSGTALVQELTDVKNSITTPQGVVVHFALKEQFINNRTNEIFLNDVPAPIFFEALAPSAPSALSRSLGETFMLGLFVSDPDEIFLIAKPTFYENAFAAMLSWEATMQQDLAPLFPKEKDAVITGSTTPPQQFEDKVIDNRDTRILSDRNGNIVILYSFIDRNTLIITGGRGSFREVLNRLSAKKVSR